ncbi:MAG: FecR family protein, partial [Proteiniphilum sp.]|nr:FecR family protein [Proteiniphilum sp.]
MEHNKNYTHFTDLLKDQEFLRWQLLPDEKLNEYWHAFFVQHPELENELQKAIDYLKKEGLNKNDLQNNERSDLFERIQMRVNQKRKRRMRHVLLYASSAAAVALLIIGITLFRPAVKPLD